MPRLNYNIVKNLSNSSLDIIQHALSKKVLIFTLLCTIICTKASLNIQEEDIIPNPKTYQPPQSASKLYNFIKSAACIDSTQCAQIGNEILQKNGSAVDVIISLMICNGVVNMQSMSLGGGFFMMIYKKDQNKVYCLNARETAPKAARNALYRDNPDSSSVGPLAVAVPGELKGYYEAHQKFGKLPFKDLVQPTVNLCFNGYSMTNHQYKSLQIQKKYLWNDTNFREWFYVEKGVFKTPRSKIIPTKLCETLQLLADRGANDFYEGRLSKMFVKDIKEAGGVITEDDLRNYKAEWVEPYTMKLKNDDTLYSAPAPASGPILGLILNILNGYNFTLANFTSIKSKVLSYHKIIETFKYAYAKRTDLGDPKFVNIDDLLKQITSSKYAERIREKIEDDYTYNDPLHYGGNYYSKSDHGTSHLGVIDSSGDAVSVTSSINIFFGAALTGKQTGIVLNSEMDDFSFPWKLNYFGLPGSPNNQMRPGKRPFSSMSPTIVLDKSNNVKLVVGAAGGSQITSSVALTLMRVLWLDKNIKEAIDAPRIHHQLMPMEVNYEYGILQQVVNGLKAIGHSLKRGVKSNVNGLHVSHGFVYGNVDYRKGGAVIGLN